MGAEARESGTKGYLRVFSGARYMQDRGLGFSLEVVPSWDASALFQEDKAGPRPSQNVQKQGLKEKQDTEKNA